ncbi:MAG TPA: NAD-dependent epimerase/dehydratase family protein [Acetobacteraceae bacterium]|nr:NAD-dependent epimerase/dehydratase family protein [Acetobacteraceae bacterium]
MSDNSSFTILGASGFIGSALVAWLESQDHVVHAVTRASLPALLFGRQPAGHVIDCIGLTGDFRSRPLDTAEAHVGLVARCLSELRFQSFLLLSSTRVYCRANATHEDTALPTVPADPSDLYNLTKLAGEALCLANRRPDIRVARLSNVYGANVPAETFLGQVLREGHHNGEVVFRQSAASAKDYVSLSAVVRLLPTIAAAGRQRIYNVAAGDNTSHATIADRLTELTAWRTSFDTDAPTLRHLPIDTTRLDAEFGPTSSNLSADLPALLATAQEHQCSQSMRHMAA